MLKKNYYLLSRIYKQHKTLRTFIHNAVAIRSIVSQKNISNFAKIENCTSISNGSSPSKAKWTFLEHKGPIFAPPYKCLPENISFYYSNEPMKLTQDAEEIACFYSRMLDHEFTTKTTFNNNFFNDWRSAMTPRERKIITSFSKCNFKEIHSHLQNVAEVRKSRTKEEKAKFKAENEKVINEHGFCIIDGIRERVLNVHIEPPGLFRGRGEHPKMGCIKQRIQPEDVIINCSNDSKFPVPPDGHNWKEIRHDPAALWLACWVENVQNKIKYIWLNSSSQVNHQNEIEKYELARRLGKYIKKIRDNYRRDWLSDDIKIRQRATALYFIDKLALRSGNEKGNDQTDTVGCCSLRVEHISLHEKLNEKKNVVTFDFLGKDSIRYFNSVQVDPLVYQNLQLFKANKNVGDDLFDLLNSNILNDYLHEIMDSLTAKVFRTYNASCTLQHQLNKMTSKDMSLLEKLLTYNRANRAVAILCNHQRAVPKSHNQIMENLEKKISVKAEAIKQLENYIKVSTLTMKVQEREQKKLERLREQLKVLDMRLSNQSENKSIALGTSKINYLDPRISVAWCHKFDVPVEKIFNQTQRNRFSWAIESADLKYDFK